MCLFGSNSSSSSSEPEADEPSDQTTPDREDSISGGVQDEREPLGRGTDSGSGSRRHRRKKGGTLVTAGDEDATAKKTLLGA